MTHKQAFRGGLAILAGMALCTVFISPAASQQSKLRIIQTNSAGDNVHIIDAATNKVAGEIKGIEAPHGITVAPDGSRIYISEESGDTLVVVDGKTMRETKRIHLSGNPNLVDVTPDGKRIYVAITLSWTDVSEFPQIKAAPSGGSTLSIPPRLRTSRRSQSRGASTISTSPRTASMWLRVRPEAPNRQPSC
jgi:YVTN family beta-propeller protein